MHIYTNICVYIYERFAKLIVSVWHDSLVCATWLTHMCDMAHSHVRHDSFTWATRLVHMCNMKYEHVRGGTKTYQAGCGCVTWFIYMRNMDCSHVTWLNRREESSGCSHVTWLNRSEEAIDWFWLRGWLLHTGAICTRTAPLFLICISLFERPRTRLVRKVRSQHQSIDCL